MRCNFCVSEDECASWKIRLTEVSNYCDDYISLDYWFSEGEDKWNEMSYNNYTETELDCTEDDWEIYLEELNY